MLSSVILVPAAFVIIAVLVTFGRRFWRERQMPTQPLRVVTGLFGRYLVLYAAAAAFSAWHGYFGGARGVICVDTGVPASGSADLGEKARTGAAIWRTGTIQACALHPSLGQWLLYLLARLPGLALWACIVLLAWRLIRAAERSGPFAPQVSTVMRRLGWVVIGGSVLAASLRQIGVDELTGMLLTPHVYDGRFILVDALVAGPLRALFPVAALAGAGLLSMARIMRLGAQLDEEIKATV